MLAAGAPAFTVGVALMARAVGAAPVTRAPVTRVVRGAGAAPVTVMVAAGGLRLRDLSTEERVHCLRRRPGHPAVEVESGPDKRLLHGPAHPSGKDHVHAARGKETSESAVIVLQACDFIHRALLHGAAFRFGDEKGLGPAEMGVHLTVEIFPGAHPHRAPMIL